MAEETLISWTDHSWSPFWGCVQVSPECDNCYALTLAKRYGHDVWGKEAPRRELSDAHWAKPLQWNRAAAAAGVRRKVFPSMCDPFEFRTGPHAEQLERLRTAFWGLIDDTPHLDWLLLTKRPQNAHRLMSEKWAWAGGFPSNVMVGASVGCLQTKWRIDALRQVRAQRRFLSLEPLLEDLGTLDLTGIHWTIAGSESGPVRSRVAQVEWFRSIKDQCVAAGIPFHLKQYAERGHKIPTPELDGVRWVNFPEARA